MSLSCSIVFSIPLQVQGTYPSFHFLSVLFCDQQGQESGQFCKFSFFVWSSDRDEVIRQFPFLFITLYHYSIFKYCPSSFPSYSLILVNLLVLLLIIMIIILSFFFFYDTLFFLLLHLSISSYFFFYWQYTRIKYQEKRLLSFYCIFGSFLFISTVFLLTPHFKNKFQLVKKRSWRNQMRNNWFTIICFYVLYQVSYFVLKKMQNLTNYKRDFSLLVTFLLLLLCSLILFFCWRIKESMN